jgi:hypothetical protein
MGHGQPDMYTAQQQEPQQACESFHNCSSFNGRAVGSATHMVHLEASFRNPLGVMLSLGHLATKGVPARHCWNLEKTPITKIIHYREY